jgi:hypothetical protein
MKVRKKVCYFINWYQLFLYYMQILVKFGYSRRETPSPPPFTSQWSVFQVRCGDHYVIIINRVEQNLWYHSSGILYCYFNNTVAVVTMSDSLSPNTVSTCMLHSIAVRNAWTSACHFECMKDEGKGKVNLSLCLTKHHAMKTYCGVEV